MILEKGNKMDGFVSFLECYAAFSLSLSFRSHSPSYLQQFPEPDTTLQTIYLVATLNSQPGRTMSKLVKEKVV
jgi:hypothetical protein